MGFDQKGMQVFHVKSGNSGNWNVMREGFEKPLASFEEETDAVKYAQDLSETKEGSRVHRDDQDGKERHGADAGR